MRCRKVFVISIAAFFLPLGIVAPAQEDDLLTPTRLRDLTAGQVDEFLQRAIDEQIPPRMADALAILLLNREQLVLPMVATRLRTALSDPAKPGELVTKLEGLLAYIASPASLDVLLSLEANYSPRVERLLPMMLSHAVGRTNPFDLAYRAMERGGDNSRQVVVGWVVENAARARNYREWARALLQRNEGHVSEFVFVADPFVSLISPDAQRNLRAEIDREFRLMIEKQEKRR